MSLIMGIDTGGTYTDGVIIDPASRAVLCKAKAFTTKSDLTIGIADCVRQLDITQTGDVQLVCLSTTLATNAIVEGRGCKVGLIIIGKAPEIKMPVDRWEVVQGSIDIKGKIKEELQESEVIRAINSFRGRVQAIAVSGYASVRNPSHELAVKRLVQEQLDLPVVCAHELTSSLGFDDRTVTACLNASLIPIIGDLIRATRQVLAQYQIKAPIMFVKGDGSLMQESFAIDKPIETILSGPAASVIGGTFLTGRKDAIILDMGGTTTDIANLDGGRTRISKKGARVGGWLTHIQAAEICTYGIGGDSYLHFGAEGGLRIGPERVIPLCVAGSRFPNLLHELQSIRKADAYELFAEQEIDCCCLEKVPEPSSLSPLDQSIVQALQDGPHSALYLARQLGRDIESLELSRLVKHGILTRISLTPTDILHVSGAYCRWDREIAALAISIMAGKLNLTTDAFIQKAMHYITGQLCIACLESITTFENNPFTFHDNAMAMYLFHKAMQPDQQALLSANFTVKKPIVAIGAPVAAWIPEVSRQLNTEAIIPEHAEVANAVGAAVGEVMESLEAIIRPGKEHLGFILHAPWEYRTFDTLEEAVAYAVPAISQKVAELARAAGSERFEVFENHEDIYTEIFGTNSRTYIETRIKATAVGSPLWQR